MSSTLSWLVEVIGEEADDRADDDDDGAEDVPMVAMDNAVADAARDSLELKDIMTLIQMAPPANQQEQVSKKNSDATSNGLIPNFFVNCYNYSAVLENPRQPVSRVAASQAICPDQSHRFLWQGGGFRA